MIRLALNPSLRKMGYLYDELGLRIPCSNPNEEVDNISSAIDGIISKIISNIYEQQNSIGGITETKTADIGLPEDPRRISNPNGDGYIESATTIIGAEDRSDNKKVSRFISKLPTQRVELTTQESHGCEQVKIAQQIFDNIDIHDYQGQYLIAPGGCGKTYIVASVIGNLKEIGFFADCISPWPCLYIAKVSIVPQNKKEVFEDAFNLDTTYTIHAVNIEQLRAKLIDEGLIIEEAYIEGGEEKFRYRWRKSCRPKLIIIDEAQGLARDQALQTVIMNCLFDEEDEALWKTYEILMSATPGSRLCEMKHFALSTKKLLKFNYKSNWSEINESYVSNAENWGVIKRHIITEVASIDTKDSDYDPLVMRNFVKHYEDRMIWIKGVEYKYKGYLDFLPIDFENDSLRNEYDKALEAHYKRKAKLEHNSDIMSEGQLRFGILASYTIFAKAAENCKRYWLARWLYENVNNKKAPAIGFRFKQTATNIIRILLEDYNWSRKDISIIWGGSIETLNAKKKLAKKIAAKGDKAKALLQELGIDIQEDLGLDEQDFIIKTDEQFEWEKQHKLITQSAQDREEERLRFVRQDSMACLFSYKSGGVGLSLHHQKEFPKALPRVGAYTPDYSEKLGVQALYRLPRLTSISDTYMWYVYYTTSIEKEIMKKYLLKCLSLQEITRNQEFWNQRDPDEDDDGTAMNNIMIKKG